jgi:hypothetical protein
MRHFRCHGGGGESEAFQKVRGVDPFPFTVAEGFSVGLSLTAAAAIVYFSWVLLPETTVIVRIRSLTFHGHPRVPWTVQCFGVQC